MKVLVIGGGGREHAICWKLRRDNPDIELHAAPGNPGIASIAKCHAAGVNELQKLVDLAATLHTDLVVIGPDNPLAAGLADMLRARGLATFGPSASAARIESSKSFAKELMLRSGIPTAMASVHTSPESAKRAARSLGAPVVIKASGLALGKGVVVANTLDEADAAIDDMLVRSVFGAAGAEVLVEEFMNGEELSVFAICDVEDCRLLVPSQDHKRLLDGDQGPNTGGMGAYAPVSAANAAIMSQVTSTILLPVLRALEEAGAPFQGLLYAGLMLTESGPRVVEFNSRFGDPETQVVLPLMSDHLLPWLLASSTPGGLTGSRDIESSGDWAVTTVLAAAGYPGTPESGVPISIPTSLPESCLVFHAGTKLDAAGRLVSSGGRVLSVTGVGPTFAEASRISTAGADAIEMPRAHWRHDIGWREARRQRRNGMAATHS